MLYALLVSDIRIDASVHGEFRPRRGWEKAAGLRHERQNTERFHADGFPAGIGSRNQQHGKISSQFNIDGDDAVFREQWMPRPLQSNVSGTIERRRIGFHIAG